MTNIIKTITLDQLRAVSGGDAATKTLKPWTTARNCATGKQVPDNYGVVGMYSVRVDHIQRSNGLAHVQFYHPMQDNPIRHGCVQPSDILDAKP